MGQYFIRHPAVAAPLSSLLPMMVAAFASLGAGAWGSTSTGATAVAAAPVRQQAGPQQPQAAPQQTGPHHATKQPTLAQGQEAMPSAGVGMAGGGGNPFRGIESPGLTAATGIAAGAAEQVCVYYVLSSHLFWTSGLWTYQPGSHRTFPFSFCGACLNFSREKDSAVLFSRRPCSRTMCTNELV